MVGSRRIANTNRSAPIVPRRPPRRVFTRDELIHLVWGTIVTSAHCRDSRSALDSNFQTFDVAIAERAAARLGGTIVLGDGRAGMTKFALTVPALALVGADR